MSLFFKHKLPLCLKVSLFGIPCSVAAAWLIFFSCFIHSPSFFYKSSHIHCHLWHESLISIFVKTLVHYIRPNGISFSSHYFVPSFTFISNFGLHNHRMPHVSWGRGVLLCTNHHCSDHHHSHAATCSGHNSCYCVSISSMLQVILVSELV